MNYFAKTMTLEEGKKCFREYAFQLHPDKGGNTDEMQELNKQYKDFLDSKNYNFDSFVTEHQDIFKYIYDDELKIFQIFIDVFKDNNSSTLKKVVSLIGLFGYGFALNKEVKRRKEEAGRSPDEAENNDELIKKINQIFDRNKIATNIN